MRDDGGFVIVLRNHAGRAAGYSAIFFVSGRVVQRICRATNRMSHVDDLRHDVHRAFADAINEGGVLWRERAFFGI